MLVPNTVFSLNADLESYRYVSSEPTLSNELRKPGTVGAAAELPFTGATSGRSGVESVVGGGSIRWAELLVLLESLGRGSGWTVTAGLEERGISVTCAGLGFGEGWGGGGVRERFGDGWGGTTEAGGSEEGVCLGVVRWDCCSDGGGCLD